jgi:hypothetical protein
LQHEPPTDLVEAYKCLYELERNDFIKYNKKGGAIDEIEAELKALKEAMEAHRNALPSQDSLDAAWVAGYDHLTSLLGRWDELRKIPKPAATCIGCGGLYPPVNEDNVRPTRRSSPRPVCKECASFQAEHPDMDPRLGDPGKQQQSSAKRVPAAADKRRGGRSGKKKGKATAKGKRKSRKKRAMPPGSRPLDGGGGKRRRR